jgi:lactoylglutathione lyase
MAAPEFAPSHLGICVSDLDRALRFWCDGMGFEKAEVFEVGAESSGRASRSTARCR